MNNITPASIGGRMSTSDSNLACCLLTNGAPLDFAHPITKVKTDRGDQVRYHFMPRTIDGKRSTKDLCEAWEKGEDHIRLFPEDGMSYCMAMVLNRRALMDLIHHSETLLQVRKGRQIALVGENAAPRIQDEILSKIR
jgi:hypothetical protein